MSEIMDNALVRRRFCYKKHKDFQKLEMKGFMFPSYINFTNRKMAQELSI